MNDIKNPRNTPEQPSRVRTSITRKLSSRMVLRLFGIFIALDIVLGLITGACLAAWSEQKIEAAARLLASSVTPAADIPASPSAAAASPGAAASPSAAVSPNAGTSPGARTSASPGTAPSPGASAAAATPAPSATPAAAGPGNKQDALLSRLNGGAGLSDITVGIYTGEAPGWTVPPPLSFLLPAATRDGKRNIEPPAGRVSAHERMENVSYVVYHASGGTTYRVAVSLRPFLHLYYIGSVILLVYELLVIISRAGKDRRFVRRTLDPITELTRATQNLNAVTRSLDPEKMAALAGKLEGINAARLDTRIQVDDTQEELRNLARAINGMLDRINESYRAQVRFVSDASHELRTPISVIQGYANLLDRWGKNDEKTLQESITAIKEEAAGMKELVEQLLFLARSDNNTIMMQPETFSLSELAAEVASEAKMIDAAHEYGTELGDVTAYADRALIKQALRILVDNAVKYTDAGGKITLITETDGAQVKISVRDSGIGISPDNIPRIFDRFYRADESRARATGGAGLGLSIANWITSRHGGYMEVLSREGIGTKITIVLPGTAAEEQKQ
jgi:two-component system sensor histidine kinase ArlS